MSFDEIFKSRQTTRCRNEFENIVKMNGFGNWKDWISVLRFVETGRRPLNNQNRRVPTYRRSKQTALVCNSVKSWPDLVHISMKFKLWVGSSDVDFLRAMLPPAELLARRRARSSARLLGLLLLGRRSSVDDFNE